MGQTGYALEQLGQDDDLSRPKKTWVPKYQNQAACSKGKEEGTEDVISPVSPQPDVEFDIELKDGTTWTL